MKNKIKSVVKGSAEFIMGAATTVVAFLLANLGCGVLVAMFVISAIIALATAKSSRYTKRGKFVIIAVSAMILMSIGMYHKNNFHNVVKEEPALAESEIVVEETPEEKTEEETTIVEEEVEVKKSNRLNDKTRKECIDLEVTKENVENLTEGKTEVEGSTTVSINETTTATDDDIIIDQAKEDDSKEVTEMEEGITAVTEKVTEEEKSEEVAQVEEDVEQTKPTEKVEISEEVVEEITSEESKNEEITEEKIEANTEIEETDKEEDFADMSDEELETLFVETTTETVTVVETVVEVEDVVEEVEVEIETPVIEIEKTEEQEIIEDEVIVEDVIEIEEEATDVEEDVVVEDIVVEEPVVEEVEVVEAVSVTAIDGYTTTVGSQIQFQVSGDDVVIEGLDGIDYTFSNGILTIDAGSEATVISVCVSNSVNAVDFNITVNGIIG